MSEGETMSDRRPSNPKQIWKTDWSYLSYHLATLGIPSDVDEDIAVNATNDPWTPPDGEEIVRLSVSKADASRLAGIVEAARISSDTAGSDTERLVAVVRRGVESGTIKGEVRQTDNHGESVWMSERPFAPGTYLVIGPIVDEEAS